MKNAIPILTLVIALAGCKKPYSPPAINSPNSYLVVEGIVNSGADSTVIKLSRTVNISNSVTTNPILNAVVTLEGDQHAVFPLTEAGGGRYVSPALNLDASQTYRLNIKTGDKQYQSDFVPVKITPPIDSIGYNIVTLPDTGLQIYINTHDPKNNTKYYRWDYRENWQFSAKYESQYVSNGSRLVPRGPDQNITDCYAGDISSTIIMASSARLKSDLIYQGPIQFIRFTSEKLEDRYSILVNQYALTSGAYNFWSNLKKNTEQLGSIFDAQPSQLQSNIHSISNASEPVIGYLSVGTVSTKRVFIYNYNLPGWAPVYPYSCNVPDTTKEGGFGTPIHDLIIYPETYVVIYPWPSAINPAHYTFTNHECGDCTIRGSKTPPPFWK